MPKHGLAFTVPVIFICFGIEGLGIYLTGVFNGDVSFLYFIYLILYSLLLIGILLWFKGRR